MLDEIGKENRPLELGRLLRAGRTAKGWTLRQAAAESGISNGYLSLIEHGEVKAPSPRHLWALADRYGIAYDQLMALAGHPSGPAATKSPSAADSTGRQARHLDPTNRAVLKGAASGASVSRLSTGVQLGPVYGVAGNAAWAAEAEEPLSEANAADGAEKPPRAARGVATSALAADDAPARRSQAAQRKRAILADDELSAEDREALCRLVLEDMRGFTVADIAQVRAFVAGMRAARRR